MHVKIRIQTIEINHIKNVGYGKVTFQDGNLVSTSGASILGVFGQNGSGKTALLDSLLLYRTLLSGEALDAYSAYLINLEEKEAIVNVTSRLSLGDEHYFVHYHFKLGTSSTRHVFVTDETLSYHLEGEKKFKPLLKATLNHHLIHVEHLDQFLVSLNPPKSTRSTLFSPEVGRVLEGREKVLYEALKAYGKDNILIINQFSNRDFRTKDVFPLIYHVAMNGYQKSVMKVRYGINYLNEDELAIFKTIVGKISLLLNNIIPGIALQYLEGKKTKRGYQVELVTKRNQVILPLKYESMGVKKLVLVIGALISMYNSHNVIVAIDEIDAGIFEYLLGEIFLVLKEEAKGQLLFTSHKLRPLEILNPYQVVFTTANPLARYLVMTKTSKKINLRDFYLRSIELGGQKENVYTSTDPFEISRAFRLAGRDDEK